MVKPKYAVMEKRLWYMVVQEHRCGLASGFGMVGRDLVGGFYCGVEGVVICGVMQRDTSRIF